MQTIHKSYKSTWTGRLSAQANMVESKPVQVGAATVVHLEYDGPYEGLIRMKKVSCIK